MISPWTDETIVRLRSLWNEGFSTAEIGRRLNVGKNSVVSKAHRLGLPARPSPIIRRDEQVPLASAPRAVRWTRELVGKSMLPSMDAPPPEVRAAAKRIAEVSKGPQTVPTAASPDPAAIGLPARPVPVAPVPVRPEHQCQWPLNSGRPWRFCGARVARDGKPYCPDHVYFSTHGTMPR